MANISPNHFGITQEALDACASEPIHIPGSIQPQGVLLVLTPDSLVICQVSINSADMIGREPAQLLGQPLDRLFVPTVLGPLRRDLAAAPPGQVTAFDVVLPVRGVARRFYIMAHAYDGLVLVELLPLDSADAADDKTALLYPPPPLSARNPVAGHDAAYMTRQITALSSDLALDTPLERFCQRVAEGVRAIAGYDRVMIYRFDDVGNGEVIAESRSPAVEPFLGLWYPAADIPPQARLLYLNNRVRALADIYAAPVPLVPQINPVTGRPPDLSYCLLRSFSPIHLEYLHNMGVRSTLTVSIITNGRLWGLIACHHYQPYWPDHDVRAAADVLSEVISIQITLREYALRSQATVRAQALQHELIRHLVGREHWFSALAEQATNLQAMLAADGVAICAGEQLATIGITPSPPEIRHLLTWLRTTSADKVLIADSLTTLSHSFATLAPIASGLIALEIARSEASYVLWFRREVVQSVTWGGNPTEKLQTEAGKSRLRPRVSFAAWTTEVRGRARPWPAESRQLVMALRSVLVEVVMDLLATRHTMTKFDLIRVRRAVEALSEPLMITDRQGTVQLVNPAFVQLTGYDLAAIRDLGGVNNLLEDPRQGAAIEVVERLQAGRWQGELTIRSRDGTTVPVLLRIDTVRNDLGEPIGHIRLYTDLRPQRLAEEERRRLDARLFEAQKLESLGVLAGGIAHDFNNLLTAMMGHANLIRLDLPADSPAHEGLSQIELAAQRAADLSRQMLAYAGRGQFMLQDINLSRLVSEMARLLETSIRKDHSLHLRLSEALLPFRGDVTQIRQVVMNLITNAADAMAERSGEIAITTDLVVADANFLQLFNAFAPLAPGRYVFLEVADTGVGMSPATMERMFDPFFSTKFVGRGLGLAAVQGIVRSHHGSLRVESELERGTRIQMLFPIVDPALPAAVAELPEIVAGSGQLVLLIDDDAGIRTMIHQVLERNGYRVVSAADGPTGIDALVDQREQIMVVLLDLTMPGMSGSETLAQVRRIDATLPVLLCSGYDEDEAMKQFDVTGVSGFVQKPFRTQELLLAIQSAITPRP